MGLKFVRTSSQFVCNYDLFHDAQLLVKWMNLIKVLRIINGMTLDLADTHRKPMNE